MAPTALDIRPATGIDSAELVDLDFFDEDELLIEEISIDGMCGVY
jgi:mycofactocin precursor